MCFDWGLIDVEFLDFLSQLSPPSYLRSSLSHIFAALAHHNECD